MEARPGFEAFVNRVRIESKLFKCNGNLYKDCKRKFM